MNIKWREIEGRWMMSLRSYFSLRSARVSLLALVTALLLFPVLVLAQTTISTGSIVGTVTDPTGSVVSGAKVVITNKETGQVITTTTTSAGTYTSGALTPGEYGVRVEAKGFKATALVVVVQVNTTAAGNVRLEVGSSTEVIEVTGSEVLVNTSQSTVQGVLTSEQIENLPINGRNFLDLAQLEPGVQIQDGGTFDPTKNGFSSVSFGGRFGRTARIEVDGIDISDETVGTTTQNLPRRNSGVRAAAILARPLDRVDFLRLGQRDHQIGHERPAWRRVLLFPRPKSECRTARRFHQSVSEKSVWWQPWRSNPQRQAVLFLRCGAYQAGSDRSSFAQGRHSTLSRETSPRLFARRRQ